MHVLLLEDDADIGNWLQDGLTRAGHVVDLFADGRDALIAATDSEYEVLILDRMTPGLDGMAVLRTLRATHVETPVLLLTALGNVDDRVDGLEAGADDYLVKPFAFSELDARVGALGRRATRGQSGDTSSLTARGIHLDLQKQQCVRLGERVDLNTREFRLLEAFVRAKGRILTRSMLLEKVWGLNSDPTTSVVDTHVSRLRAKIERPFGDVVIRTVRGTGYILDP